MKIFPRLSSIFVPYSVLVIRFLKPKILIAFNVEKNTWAFEWLEHYLEREIQGMLKSFPIWRNKKIFSRIVG